MGLFRKTKIKLKGYDDLNFIPFHQLKKENQNIEPYIKGITINFGPEFQFFQIKGEIYAIKPTNKKDYTKFLAVKVQNPITKRSAQGSIIGNCAKGVKEEYVLFMSRLMNANLDEIEVFRHIVLNLDGLK